MPMNAPASSATAAASSAGGAKALRFAVRVVVFLAVAWCVGTLLHKATARADTDPSPAGFGRGALHGAMMPLALPGLALGKDVSIYAERNTGRTYKLGYTVGVNACGLIFFGVFFWRVRRWRRTGGN
jgi:hypothetical protein